MCIRDSADCARRVSARAGSAGADHPARVRGDVLPAGIPRAGARSAGALCAGGRLRRAHALPCLPAVSYTHLDVYKRQLYHIGIPEDQIMDLATNECNTTPCMMPYVCLLYTSRPRPVRTVPNRMLCLESLYSKDYFYYSY